MVAVRAQARLGAARRRAPPVRLEPGDVAIVRGPDHYTVADDPATAPQVVIHPGQRCTTLDGEPLAQAMHLGVRTWGNAGEVTSTARHRDAAHGHVPDDRRAERATARRPPGDRSCCATTSGTVPLLDLLAAEIVRDEPGQEAVLDRLLDLVLIAALRTWLGAARRATRRAGTAPSTIPSSGAPCGCSSTTRSSRGPWPRSPGPPASRGPPSPAASPSSSASRR